ncbi:MAG: Gfo/Idh/MocA family oxidoreductase [Bryobacteraceae bacterium]|nr:Gfo/Idh/MocA family oxidoreductase [Bryobacteraceae bacterium]MDW8380337.1 Gfo/Idh/MocA family oxidoreductase [Bryobacterales bacterium]
MSTSAFVPKVCLIGGGMIAHDQILPSLYQLQRLKAIGEIWVCSQHGKTTRALAEAEPIRRAFPGFSFVRYPKDDSGPYPLLYRDVIAALPPRQIVVVAVPDPLHFDVVMTALRCDQHVMCVKPLVLKVEHAEQIEREARARGLVVGVEYHKRFDDRSLMARRRYREGLFGEFKLGCARLMEKWYYRHSNFQNWCTVENSDAFTYIGCHYVDLVHFITGLLPHSVSVYGIQDKYPNGNMGFLWTDARIIWQNGACLNVQNSLSFPDAAPGTNTQGMSLYFGAREVGGWLEHSDQYRGLRYSYVRKPEGAGATQFAEPSPDYFTYVDLGGPGLTPVGYGYRSIEYIIRQCIRVETEASTLEGRQKLLKEIDEQGIMATPANSRYNELVTEAGRLSILNGGKEVVIEYGDSPHVRFRD